MSKFKIGDEVRLNRGWTRMVVIGIKDNGDIQAQYDRGEPGYAYGITLDSYKYPEFNESATRPASGFTRWDGKPAQRKHPMPTIKYRVTNGPYKGQIGTFLNTTSDGAYALELSNGDVRAFTLSIIEEEVPFTFRVKSISNNYRYTYEAPANTNVYVGDVLLSSTGNVYVVLETKTKSRSVKGVFKGTRLVQETL